MHTLEPDAVEIIGCELWELAKPSGSLFALLCIAWHCPTETTANLLFRLVFDPTNPCINIQKTKIGSSRKALTADARPLRMDIPKDGAFGKGLDWWGAWEELCIDFLAKIAKYAAVRLVLGKQNNLALEDEFKSNDSVVGTRVNILVEGKTVKIYQRKAQLYHSSR